MAYDEMDMLPVYVEPIWEDGRLQNAPDTIKWSGHAPPPAIGAQIKVPDIGTATVTRYFVEHYWLGLICQLESGRTVHVFGIDLNA